jgi:CheY-like chemotaxis protein
MARILIAEDEPDIRELITITLHFAGHEVISTTNGEEAVRLSGQELPDLILLDMRMPRISGYEACQQIKSNPNTRLIPVAFLSARGQDAEVQACLAAGAEEYLLKPFSPEELIHVVQAMLEKKRG